MFIIMASVLVISACKKKEEKKEEEPQEELRPVASFTTDKTEYYGGWTIILTNTSQNGGTIKWTLPNGTTSNDNVVSYVTSTTAIELDFPIRLDVTSPRGTKTDYVVNAVKVYPTDAAPPAVDFTTSVTNYYGGDLITVISTVEANTYKWTLPDGSTREGQKTAIYNTSTSSAENSLSFKLEVGKYTSHGLKTSSITKSVTVKPTPTKTTKTELLTSGLWKITAYVQVLADSPPYDYYASMNDCEKDNLFKFDTYGEFVRDEADNRCYNNNNQYNNQHEFGTWSFNQDETTLTITGGNNIGILGMPELDSNAWTIVNLTSTTLEISYTLPTPAAEIYKITLSH